MTNHTPQPKPNFKYTTLERAQIMQGSPVARLDSNEAPKGFNNVTKWANAIFAQQNNQAINPELGNIALTLKSVRDSLAHGKGINPFKAITFLVIKNIIEKGAVVLNASHDKQESYYICAPLLIDEKEQIGTVLVKRDASSQRMYLHSVSVKEKLLNYRLSRADISKDTSETPRPTNLEAYDKSIPTIKGKAQYSDVALATQYYLTLDLTKHINQNNSIATQATKPIIRFSLDNNLQYQKDNNDLNNYSKDKPSNNVEPQPPTNEFNDNEPPLYYYDDLADYFTDDDLINNQLADNQNNNIDIANDYLQNQSASRQERPIAEKETTTKNTTTANESKFENNDLTNTQDKSAQKPSKEEIQSTQNKPTKANTKNDKETKTILNQTNESKPISFGAGKIAPQDRVYIVIAPENEEQKQTGLHKDEFKQTMHNAGKKYGTDYGYDLDNYSWYVHKDIEPSIYAQWSTTHIDSQIRNVTQATTEIIGNTNANPNEDLANYLRDLGLNVTGNHPIMDGKSHRISTLYDKKGVQSASYRAFNDGVPNATISIWGQGRDEQHKWIFKPNANSQPLSQLDKNRYNALRNAQKLNNAIKDEIEYQKAYDKLVHDYQNAKPIAHNQTHAYLKAKNIKPTTDVKLNDKNGLVIPIYDINGKLQTTQTIYQNSDNSSNKILASKGKKTGHFHPIGGIANFQEKAPNAKAIFIAEGYATCVSIHEALKAYPKEVQEQILVVSAIDAGNLKEVATNIKDKYQQINIEIVADNDKQLNQDGTPKLDKKGKSKSNVGVEKAQEAAQAVGGNVIIPEYPKQANKPNEKLDFNDLANFTDNSQNKTDDQQDNDNNKRSKQGRSEASRQLKQSLEKLFPNFMLGYNLVSGLFGGDKDSEQAKTAQKLAEEAKRKAEREAKKQEKLDIKLEKLRQETDVLKNNLNDNAQSDLQNHNSNNNLNKEQDDLHHNFNVQNNTQEFTNKKTDQAINNATNPQIDINQNEQQIRKQPTEETQKNEPMADDEYAKTQPENDLKANSVNQENKPQKTQLADELTNANNATTEQETPVNLLNEPNEPKQNNFQEQNHNAHIDAYRNYQTKLTKQTDDIAHGKIENLTGLDKVKSIHDIAKKISANWKNSPQIIIAQDINDPILPKEIRQTNSQNSTTRIKGVYYQDELNTNGKVFLIASNLKSSRYVSKTLYHEVLGHHGLRGYLGKDVDLVLDKVAFSFRKETQTKCEQYGLNSHNLNDRRIAAEEVLAEIAEQTPNATPVNNFANGVRSFFRNNVPGFSEIPLSKDETLQLINLGKSFVQNHATDFSITKSANKLRQHAKIKGSKIAEIKTPFLGKTSKIYDHGNRLSIKGYMSEKAICQFLDNFINTYGNNAPLKITGNSSFKKALVKYSAKHHYPIKFEDKELEIKRLKAEKKQYKKETKEQQKALNKENSISLAFVPPELPDETIVTKYPKEPQLTNEQVNAFENLQVGNIDNVNTLDKSVAQKFVIRHRKVQTPKTRANYEQRIDELFSGKKHNFYGIKILDRSNMLGLLENNTYPVYLVESKVIKGREKHEKITAEHWKQVPIWLENPAMVFKSATDPNRLVFIAPQKIDNKPVLIVVEPNGMRGKTPCTNVIVNTYDFNQSQLQGWINKGLLKYADRESLTVKEYLAQNKKSGVLHESKKTFQAAIAFMLGANSTSANILTEKDLKNYKSQLNTNPTIRYKLSDKPIIVIDNLKKSKEKSVKYKQTFSLANNKTSTTNNALALILGISNEKVEQLKQLPRFDYQETLRKPSLTELAKFNRELQERNKFMRDIKTPFKIKEFILTKRLIGIRTKLVNMNTKLSSIRTNQNLNNNSNISTQSLVSKQTTQTKQPANPKQFVLNQISIPTPNRNNAQTKGRSR